VELIVGRERERARGLDLLRQVYGELYIQLGDRFSAAELLQAAQTLIDVSHDEYGDTLFKEGRLAPGYYSYAVDEMLGKRPWWPLENERLGESSEDRLAQDERAQQTLKHFFGPNSYYKREYW
jgi:hypothetical protein